MKKRNIFFLFLIIIIAGLVFLAIRNIEKVIISDIYPNTDKDPVLELTWEGELDPKSATRYTPYGVWEARIKYPDGVAYEPANEMQFYITSSAENFLAIAPGIVTQNEIHEGETGLVSVRYGENFTVTYMHIIPNQELKLGAKIEAGDVLGKMEKRMHDLWGEETWWEIQVTKRVGKKFRTMPPYNYFSQEGKAILNEIAIASKETGQNWISAEGSNGWTIVDGCSWIKYTKEPSWWNSNRFDFKASPETEKEFIDSLGLGWKIGDEQGRVIGPNDKCN